MDTSGSEPKRRNVKELNYVVTDELSKTGLAMTHHLLEMIFLNLKITSRLRRKKTKYESNLKLLLRPKFKRSGPTNSIVDLGRIQNTATKLYRRSQFQSYFDLFLIKIDHF